MQTAYNKDVRAADDLYLSQRYEEALESYRKIESEGSSFEDGILSAKMGACFEALGGYPKSLQFYRAAYQKGGSWDLSEFSEMAYLAYKHQDMPTFNSLRAEAKMRWLGSDTAEDPRKGVAASGPAWSDQSDVQVLLLFGKTFADLNDRPGVDFAYKEALELSHGDPMIGFEYANVLMSSCEDNEAGWAIGTSLDLPEIEPFRSRLADMKRDATWWSANESAQAKERHRQNFQKIYEAKHADAGYRPLGIYN